MSEREAKPHCSLPPEDQQALLDIARNSLISGIQYRRPASANLDSLSPALRAPRATFVTLEKHGSLRGCIGSLHAVRPLAQDVAHNAFAAGFQDPRFPPLSAAELPALDIHISILSPLEPMQFESEKDFLRQLRPGIDGILLAEGPHQGTFLPSVWEQLPDPEQFLAHLKLKAGLPPTYWSDTIRAWRYTTEVVSGPATTPV